MTKYQDVKTHLGLSINSENSITDVLITLLADSMFIQNLYKKYHWHVEGENFYQYHLLFDKHAEEQIPIIDLIAERIRTLGNKAPGMPQDVTANKSVSEPKEPGNNHKIMITNLVVVHGAIIKKVRHAVDVAEKLNDSGTGDLLVSSVLRVQELQLWFIRSCLEK